MKSMILINKTEDDTNADIMQSLSKYPWHFHRPRSNNPTICMELKKTWIAKKHEWQRRTKLEVSHSPISDYTINTNLK